MNKIVRDYYPVKRLPQDLREEVGNAEYVRLVIENVDARPPLSKDALKRLLKEAREHARGVTTEEAVSRIRALRDEWDD
mgnify:CR=1 FL=1